MKCAKNHGDDYKYKQKLYSNASQKVKQINRDKKVQLRELSMAEKKRDDLKEDFEKSGVIALHYIQDAITNGKLTISKQICDYIHSSLQSYSQFITTLQKVQQDITEIRDVIKSYDDERIEKEKKLQDELSQFSKVVTKSDDIQHPDLLPESESIKLLSPLIPRYNQFYVRKEGSQKKYLLTFNLIDRSISLVYDGLKETEVIYSVDDIVYLVKGKKNKENVLICIIFKGREDKPEKIIFNDPPSRELFYELYWLAKRGIGKTFLSESKRPITHEELLIWCGTWNMGDAQPEYNNHQALENWMPKEKYDFYVVSTQESEYTPRNGYISPEEDLWSLFRNHLGDNYIKLANVSLQHIRLACFVRRNHYYKICKVKVGTVATGLAGVIGNKGGCGIAFDIYDNRICFVGSHLAARIDRKRLEARNQNYRDILKGLSNGFSKNGLSDIHHEFDHLIWLGDLNYRIEMSRDEIISKVQQNDLESLTKRDQLFEEMKLENCFVDFEEMEIRFTPTYRYNRGDRTFSEEKMREPAWCDRVLYKSIKSSFITPLTYNACHDLVTSDHSPVSATFSISIGLPSIPHIRDTNCKITISNIKAFDLKPQRSSSGYYVVFQAAFLTSDASTSPSEKTTSPSWNERIYLYPAITNRSYLTHQWIRVVIRESKQDTCQGQGVIYLEHAMNGAMDFRTRIVDKSRIYGYVEGTISVEFSDGYQDPYPYSSEPQTLKSSMTTMEKDSSTSIQPSFSIATKQTEHIQLDGIQEDHNDLLNESSSPRSWSTTRPSNFEDYKQSFYSNTKDNPLNRSDGSIEFGNKKFEQKPSSYHGKRNIGKDDTKLEPKPVTFFKKARPSLAVRSKFENNDDDNNNNNDKK